MPALITVGEADDRCVYLLFSITSRCCLPKITTVNLNLSKLCTKYCWVTFLLDTDEYFQCPIMHQKLLTNELCSILSQEMRCLNHVRTIYRDANSGEIYACCTGACVCQEFYLNVRQRVCYLPNFNAIVT